MGYQLDEARRCMILALMEEKNYKPMKLKELCMIFSVSKWEKDEFKEFLDQMIASGDVMIMKDGRYAKNQSEFLTGQFMGNRRGFGFVRVPDMTSDIFIPADAVYGAFHGDTVKLVITDYGRRGGKADKRSAEGRIVGIEKRGFTEIVGTFQRSKKYGFVVPDNVKIGCDIYVARENFGKAKTGDKVVVKMESYGDYKHSPEGRIIEILGRADDARVDVMSVIRAFGIPTEFPEDVKIQVQSVPAEVSLEEVAGRMDLRDQMTVTIDGEDAKDLDDAITLSKRGKHFRLGVHIADVTHYVPEGSPLDREAAGRGTSVYFVNKVIPMLPRELSNGICSLNEGVDRLALSCIMEIDEKGKILGHEIAETVIRVNHRMSYTQVAAILDGDEALSETYSDAADMFKDMLELSSLLREKRRERGGIDFDFPESKIILDDRDLPVDIHPYDRNPATKIIEDFMLMANETIAEDFFWQELPFLYRTHEAPDADRIRKLVMLIRGYGYSLSTRAETIHPKEFQKLLGKIEGTPEETMISRLVLRSMKQAKYTTSNLGHFGLAVGNYCHFTSPIRRYPDLQIHRIIKEQLHGLLDDERQSHYHAILPEVAMSSSATERRADEAEREIVKMKKCEYMSKRIGQRYDGVISGITGRGMYVELHNTCEGLVSLQDLYDDYYEYDESSMTLTGIDHGRVFKLGDRVKVRVFAVDFASKTVMFVPDEQMGGFDYADR